MTLEDLILKLRMLEESRGVVSHDVKTNVTEVALIMVYGRPIICLTPMDYHCANCGTGGHMTHNVYCHECYNKYRKYCES